MDATCWTMAPWPDDDSPKRPWLCRRWTPAITERPLILAKRSRMHVAPSVPCYRRRPPFFKSRAGGRAGSGTEAAAAVWTPLCSGDDGLEQICGDR
jgi:hypothetical protein